jgi:hypothetical protein
MTTYRCTAYTAQQDGYVFELEGTLKQARAAAERYAHAAFPAWGYAGHGPTIVVATLDGERVIEERL